MGADLLVIALIAGVLGFTDMQIVSATIAKFLFAVFLFGFFIIVAVGSGLAAPARARRRACRGLCQVCFVRCPDAVRLWSGAGRLGIC
jgi:uncharacterized membrane protein YtjA (UPF0391 family)